MDCEKCNGTGYLDGHGHVPGKADHEGREHSCYEAGCPHPCETCQGTGSYSFDGSTSVEVNPDAPF